MFTLLSFLLRTTVIYTFIQSVREKATAPLYEGSNKDSINLSINTYMVFTPLHLFDCRLGKISSSPNQTK
jgi:hypothetical protein